MENLAFVISISILTNTVAVDITDSLPDIWACTVAQIGNSKLGNQLSQPFASLHVGVWSVSNNG